jgi:hypothetical protein
MLIGIMGLGVFAVAIWVWVRESKDSGTMRLSDSACRIRREDKDGVISRTLQTF